MNVIKFDLEIQKACTPRALALRGYAWYKSGSKTVMELFDKSFVEEFGDKFAEGLRENWDQVVFPQMKALISGNQLIGYAITRGIHVYLFNKNNHSLQSTRNLSIEAIAFGDQPVPQILNYAFKKVHQILSRSALTCEHIDDTRIFIFPFNSQDEDIHSSDLKIRAELKSRFNIGKAEYARWAVVTLLTLLTIFLYLMTPGPTPDPNGTPGPEPPVRTAYMSLACSGVFYLLLDLITYFIVPLFSGRGHRRVEISDLSSFVETKKLPEPGNSRELTEPSE